MKMRQDIKNYKLFAGCISFSMMLLASTTQADSLTDAIHSALANNPEINIMRAGSGAAHVGIDEANGGYYPKVTLRVSQGREHSNTPTTGNTDLTLSPYEMSVSLNQTIFDGGLTSSRVEGAKAQAAATQSDLLNTAETVASQTAELYLEVLKYKDLIQEAELYLDVQNRLLALVKERVKQRVGRQSDIDETQSRKRSAEAAIYSAKGDMESAMASYIALVGDQADEPQNPIKPDIVVATDEDSALEIGLANNPQVISSQMRVVGAKAVEKEKRAAFIPDVSLTLKSTNDWDLSGSQGISRVNSGMIVANYALFSGGADLKKKQAATLLRRQAEYTYEREKRNFTAKIKKSLSALETAKKRKQAFVAQVEENKKVRDAFSQQYGIGKRTLFDLLDVEQSLFNSKNSLVTERYKETIAKFKLLAVQGLLLKTLRATVPTALEPEAWNIFGK
jgi:outer membrane protein, adhesin transport system